MANGEEGPGGFLELLKKLFPSDPKLDSISKGAGEEADAFGAELKALDEQIRERTEYDYIGHDSKGKVYHSYWNHPANVFARERAEARKTDRVDPDPQTAAELRAREAQDVAFFEAETEKLMQQRSELTARMQNERLKSMFTELISRPVGTVADPARQAAGAVRSTAKGAVAGGKKVVEGGRRVVEGVGNAKDQMGELLTGFVNFISSLDLGAGPERYKQAGENPRDPLMSAIAHMDSTGLAPLIQAALSGGDGKAQGGTRKPAEQYDTPNTPRARAAERFAGR